MGYYENIVAFNSDNKDKIELVGKLNAGREQKDSFNKSNVIGKLGEDMAYGLLNQLGLTDVTDVSDMVTYQDIDVDLLFKTSNGVSNSLEIKTDSTEYESIFYETISNVQLNSIGCLAKSKSKWVLYFFINHKDSNGKLLVEGYLVKLKHLREYIEEHDNIKGLVEFKQFWRKDLRDAWVQTAGKSIKTAPFEKEAFEKGWLKKVYLNEDNTFTVTTK